VVTVEQPVCQAAPRYVTTAEIPAMARGCAVLGAGGGGDATMGMILADEALSRYGPVRLATLDDLAVDDPEGLVLPLSALGAPTAAMEQLHSGQEPVLIRQEVERRLGRPVIGVMPTEIGGVNGLWGLAWAARLGLPLLDADGMGRAFPEIDQVSMHVAGIPVGLVVLADVAGNVVTMYPRSARWAEQLGRQVCVAMGSVAVIADHIMTVRQARGAVITGSVSTAIAIGAAVGTVSGQRVPALTDALHGVEVITGKIIEVSRTTSEGFVRGEALIEGTGADHDRLVRLEIQNENLVAMEDGRLLVTVPDLISVVDAQTADAVSSEHLRYGQRVAVVASPCAGLWRTPAGLAVAGPRAFGYECDHLPVEALAAALGRERRP
jgi:DUF917 family protein